MDRAYECGKILNTHGVRGELKVDLWCDAEEVFSQLDTVYIRQTAYRIRARRPAGRFMLITLDGVSTVEQGMALKNQVMTVPRSSIRLAPGRFFYSDIYGFSVFDERTARVIGTLDEVRDMPSGILYVVRDGARDILIPAAPVFVLATDFEARRITVRTIEGMLPDEN